VELAEASGTTAHAGKRRKKRRFREVLKRWWGTKRIFMLSRTSD
jgi:hypothetical protein